MNVDSFLRTPIQKDLANQTTNKARIYKNYFDCLALHCDSNLDEPGVIAAVCQTIVNLRQNLPVNIFSKKEVNDLAMKTAIAYLELQKMKDKLVQTGIPELGFNELCRRVTDSDIPDSKPILIR